MADGLERTIQRLDNLQKLEPLIAAMRILALRTVQSSLNRLERLADYRSGFTGSLAAVEAVSKRSQKKAENAAERNADVIGSALPKPTLLAVFGSESGLCGGYDRALLEVLNRRLESENTERIEIEVFGVKLLTRLKSAPFAFRAMGSLSRNGTPLYRALHERVQDWSTRFEKREIRAVELISYRRTGSGAARPEITPYLGSANRLGPSEPAPFIREPESEESAPDWKSAEGSGETKDSDWLPLIEGDPERIAEELRRDLTEIEAYQYLLESIAAENQARFRLLDEARENTSALIDELKVQAQLEKRQVMTQQIQELAVSAGLVRS